MIYLQGRVLIGLDIFNSKWPLRKDAVKLINS